MKIDREFAKLLGPDQRIAFDGDVSAICGVSPDLRLAYWNDAWELFARKNGGASVLEQFTLGRSILDAISGQLRSFYELILRSVAQTGEEFEHLYECSSADLVRWFHMRVLPLGKDGALLFVHSLAVERPRGAAEEDAYLDATDFRGDGGLILQCSNCRRVRRVDPKQWEWHRLFMEARPAVSHGVCLVCLELYYPEGS